MDWSLANVLLLLAALLLPLLLTALTLRRRKDATQDGTAGGRYRSNDEAAQLRPPSPPD